jgi:hypothetical protein
MMTIFRSNQVSLGILPDTTDDLPKAGQFRLGFALLSGIINIGGTVPRIFKLKFYCDLLNLKDLLEMMIS